MIELLNARESDCIPIFDVLMQMLHKSPAKQMALAEPDQAYRALKQAVREGRLYLYGDYAILVDVGSPWHTTKRVLIEEIIVRFRRVAGNSPETAIAQLDRIAFDHGCVAIAAGDTQVGIMEPRYLAAGYSTLGKQFYKEVPLMGFVRKITGVQAQIDATNRNADAQIIAGKQNADAQAEAAKTTANAQVQAMNASARAAADQQRLLADRSKAEGAAADAAGRPLAVADVALDAGATESASVARRRSRQQFGKNYGSGARI